MNVKAQYQRESAIAEEGIMEELADATGGRYFHNNNDLKAGFGEWRRRRSLFMCWDSRRKT
jgi:hypothetical protein